jgi:hypothetical protein
VIPLRWIWTLHRGVDRYGGSAFISTRLGYVILTASVGRGWVGEGNVEPGECR